MILIKAHLHRQEQKWSSIKKHPTEKAGPFMGWRVGMWVQLRIIIVVFVFFVPDKHSEVNSDTVKFIPRYIPIPECSIDDHLKKTVNDLVHLLLNKSPAVPVLQPESARAALIKIAELLNRDSSPNIKEIPQPTGEPHAPTHIPTTTTTKFHT